MTRAERPRRGAVLAAALAALSLTSALTACDDGNASTREPAPTTQTPSGSPPSPAVPAPRRYVALGDSYTAAPFVPTTDVAGGCFRSSGNYPSLVTAALQPDRAVDVSCGGADSADLLGPQRVARGRATVPAQLRAVRPDADLVTVGIGGNDGNLFTQLVCSFTRERFALCDVASDRDVEATLAQTRADVTEALRTVVRRAAPGALVLLVGYPHLVDPTRSCPALPLESSQRAQVARVEQQLRATLRTSARQARVGFLDLFGPSTGHEVCSKGPWVNGGQTDRSRALAYHPFAEEQEAVARLVEARWREHAS